MTKLEFVDQFFEDGTLQLGSFTYFAECEHPEIGDMTEGHVIVIADSDQGTTIARICSGYEELIFCAYAGIPDSSTLERFGYDSGFIIDDPLSFSKALGEVTAAHATVVLPCIYSDRKAVRSIDYCGVRHNLDGSLAQVAGVTKYLLKPSRFSHQNEVRIILSTQREVAPTTIVRCPEARQYCRRL